MDYRKGAKQYVAAGQIWRKKGKGEHHFMENNPGSRHLLVQRAGGPFRVDFGWWRVMGIFTAEALQAGRNTGFSISKISPARPRGGPAPKPKSRQKEKRRGKNDPRKGPALCLPRKGGVWDSEKDL